MEAIWFEAIGILILISLVGFFSAAEVSVLSTRKSRMQELTEEGNKKAAIVLGFQTNPERFLATVHVGTIFSMLIASALAALIAIKHIVPGLEDSPHEWLREASPWIAIGAMALAIGFLVVVFGQLVPRSLALRHSGTVALKIAPTMRLFAALFRGPAQVLTFASNAVLRVFSDRTTFTESRISEEEFKLLLEEGTKTGVIDKTEHELIESVFEFTDTSAKEVMIPRPDVVALDAELTREEIVKKVLEEGYSRLPVYRDTIDTIIGIVYSKDLLSLMEFRDLIVLQDILRPAFFVPDTQKISHIMRDLQQRRLHLAIVTDEFGGTAGIITMEDILEEIVGEIHDEYDEIIRDIEQGTDGSFLVNARLGIRDFNERFHAELPETDEYDTISGFLYKQTGKIPDINEEITFNNLVFSIVKKSQRRIRLVKFRRRETPAPAPPA